MSVDALDFAKESGAMRRLFTQAARVAPHDMTVLITGEAGVGKERLARWIHAHSRCADRPFVPVDCAALQELPVDSRLFAHAGGAFPDGVGEIFDAAGGGTLFVDEISDASPAMQGTLVRVIEEPQTPRVGDGRLRRLDVRLIAATKRNLRNEVAQRRFRQGLLYCLLGGLHIPPLRERPGDLLVLAGVLLEIAATRRGRAIGGFAPQVLAHFFAYDWPGNVRQLEETIDEACAAATGPEIQVADLPEPLRHACRSTRWQGMGPSAAVQSLEDLTGVHLRAALRRHRGNRRLAAAALGISRLTLNRRLRRG